jgi:imidazoleglycerol phosphate synthase glutamine amidotransferase subunit HisH
MVVIVDYKCGNGNAIVNMLKYIGIDGILSSSVPFF